jgi:hypothetical protein
LLIFRVHHDNNFNDYIYQEKEFLKKSVNTNNVAEKDFEFEVKKGNLFDIQNWRKSITIIEAW